MATGKLIKKYTVYRNQIKKTPAVTTNELKKTLVRHST